ncbi:hypothetical protein Q5H92_23975 [Hymenobacter sp. M29]|uniref:DUF2380 domain-containing protein n=1 Tax=Hymenobacter mellowenesis TaxID=3063995 RepID=A0ABT9AHY5_9BACT|nr:hypothetical protein [Hymenobacter sp. M29]MDO7849444.1 hypothetical protein [Hymenobacter sp. M29]
MKRLLVILLLLYLPARAQHLAPHKTPAHEEGVNVIGVLLPDSGAVLLERVARVLQVQGYVLGSRNETTLQLTTEPQPLHGCSCYASFEVTVMGHAALLSGVAGHYYLFFDKRPLSYSAFSHVAFQNTDFIAEGWALLETIARGLSDEAVYFRRP